MQLNKETEPIIYLKVFLKEIRESPRNVVAKVLDYSIVGREFEF